MIVLRSPGLGALSLLPNAIPGLMAFGLWGLRRHVHFPDKFLCGRRKRGL